MLLPVTALIVCPTCVKTIGVGSQRSADRTHKHERLCRDGFPVFLGIAGQVADEEKRMAHVTYEIS